MNIIDNIIECIQSNKPISFLKFGDGEIICMFKLFKNSSDYNVDHDTYTDNLRNGLLDSFKYIIENPGSIYIGKWHHDALTNYLQNYNIENIKWANYHTLLLDKQNDDKKIDLLKIIKSSKLKKIVICNEQNKKIREILDADNMLFVSPKNWFDKYFYEIMDSLENIIKNNDKEGHIVITCCGMGAKVLLTELIKKFPNGIYLDYGSFFDKICRGFDTRTYHELYSYPEIINILKEKEIITNNW